MTLPTNNILIVFHNRTLINGVVINLGTSFSAENFRALFASMVVVRLYLRRKWLFFCIRTAAKTSPFQIADHPVFCSSIVPFVDGDLSFLHWTKRS